MEALSKLKNAKITDVRNIHDYLQIATDKGMINIYNKLHNLNFGDIIGHTIIDITDEKLSLTFKMSNGSSIAISLDDNDYAGPEAFNIYLNSGEIIVG